MSLRGQQNGIGSRGQSNGAVASGLAALNAAHASSQGLLNASADSEVGKIAIYKGDIGVFLGSCGPNCSATDLTTAALVLAAASNKTLTTDTLIALNSLLGVDTSTDSTWGTDSQAIVDQVNAAQ